jgi:hypothetical protein
MHTTFLLDYSQNLTREIQNQTEATILATNRYIDKTDERGGHE